MILVGVTAEKNIRSAIIQTEMIKFVYFDVGGVLIKDFSDSNKWEELKKSKNITDPDFDSWFDELEVRLLLGTATLDESPYDINDFVSRFERNEPIWQVVNSVKQKFSVGLLTNQYKGLFDGVVKAGLMSNLDWNVVIDSSVEGVSKPDVAIFKLAESRCGFTGNEILFIDNGEKHIKAAREYGWQTFLYDSEDYEKSSRDLLKFISPEKQ